MILQVGVKALIRKDKRYLFLLRSKGFRNEPQKWDIPGGRIEADEPLENALAREVREETGLTLNRVSTLLSTQDIFVDEKDIHVVRLTYVAEASGKVSLSDEHETYRWMTSNEVLAETNVDEYLRKVLQK